MPVFDVDCGTRDAATLGHSVYVRRQERLVPMLSFHGQDTVFAQKKHMPRSDTRRKSSVGNYVLNDAARVGRPPRPTDTSRAEPPQSGGAAHPSPKRVPAGLLKKRVARAILPANRLNCYCVLRGYGTPSEDLALKQPLLQQPPCPLLFLAARRIENGDATEGTAIATPGGVIVRCDSSTAQAVLITAARNGVLMGRLRSVHILFIATHAIP